jgi:hypothetical protein
MQLGLYACENELLLSDYIVDYDVHENKVLRKRFEAVKDIVS